MNHPSPAPTPNPNNRLSRETSPYLLQHQHNPVDWYAWGEAALAEAKSSNRPILLSVGYAACHWCHVMAHESFEDTEIAAAMNRLFVNIKIDREERPDLDAIYQQALALLGQQGGWPLTMFLMPDGKPFWGGTYFPKEARYGRPGFGDVLNFISETYHRDAEKVRKNVAGLAEAMEKLSAPQTGGEISRELTDQIAERLLGEVDFESGGIGSAPKFPQAALFNSFWRAYKRQGNTAYKDAVTLTLIRMAQGGIYDHLGGGLARYATDAHWLVPHFEKMLYDNAEFVSLLALVWQETRDPLFEARVRETVAWLEREMLAEADSTGNRAFAASLDADSEGEEGKFYVWTEAEIVEVLGPADAAFFIRHYDVTVEGNWEGHNILNRTALPAFLGVETESRLAVLREQLLARRTRRIRPGWDDKVLVDWNGLMIAALAEAAEVFKEPHWLKVAQSAFAFIRATMFKNGRLFHAWRKGKLAHPATLDDHANLAQAALALHEATGGALYLAAAREITDLLNRHYWDGGVGGQSGAGGYFMTAEDTADVVIRPKSAADNATPNGNGTMAGVLARLYHLTGESVYLDRAHALIAAFSGEIGRNFFPLATLLNNNDFLHNALQIVVIGDRKAKDTQAMVDIVLGTSLPNRLLQIVAPAGNSAGEKLPKGHPALGKTQIEDKATVYLCKGQSCGLPVNHPAGLRAALALG